MSIIHEALKKVQDKLNPPHTPVETLSHTTSEPISPMTETSTPKKTQPLTLMIGVPIIVGLAVWLYIQYVHPTLPHMAAIKLPAISLPATASKQQPKVTPSKKNTPPALIEPQLQGIFKQDNTRIALINNSMYQVGDKFGSFDVVNIENDSVLLSGKDSAVILKLAP